MGLKALDAPKSLFGTLRYLIASFSKCALFLARLESSPGLLETSAKMPLNVSGRRLGNAGTDRCSAVSHLRCPGCLQRTRRSPSPATSASSLNLPSSPSRSSWFLCSGHLSFTSSGLWPILHWVVFCRFRSFDKFCQGRRSQGKGWQRNGDGSGCIRTPAASS